MILRASYHKRIFQFTETRHTSRDSLDTKISFFLRVEDTKTQKVGIGECSYLASLSPEKWEEYETKIKEVCDSINNYKQWLNGSLDAFPSIQFGLEMAIQSLFSTSNTVLFDTPFAKGEQAITINGLIWMDSFDKMKEEIDAKLATGFTCIKLKIGAIDFQKELDLLAYLRSKSSDITIRVDANGAFTPENALEKLEKLSKYNIHSIEQPIKQNQWESMRKLSELSPIPIALDEELIGRFTISDKRKVLAEIKPAYLILKPSLIGGFKGTKEWIELANEFSIDWWATSCLESNVGLQAIAQFVSTYNNPIPQGLGTGKIYTNNITSGLYLEGEHLYHNPNIPFDFE